MSGLCEKPLDGSTTRFRVDLGRGSVDAITMAGGARINISVGITRLVMVRKTKTVWP